MKIRTLIVDDEPHAIAVLEKYLAQFNQMELVVNARMRYRLFSCCNKNRWI